MYTSIRISLIIAAMTFLMGCGSEAKNLDLDNTSDTKPDTSMAFTLSELQDKEIYVTKGETTMRYIFHTTKYEIHSMSGLTLQAGTFSINSDGTITLGSNIYTRTSIDSSQKWSVNESYDVNGDGVVDHTSATSWYFGTQYALAFSITELAGTSMRHTQDGVTTVLSFTSANYERNRFNTDGSVTTTKGNYNLNADGSITLNNTTYIRVGKEGIVWTIEEHYDSDGDGSDESVETLQWHLDELALSVSELNGKTLYTVEESANLQLSFNETSIMGSYYTTDGTEPLEGTYFIPYTIDANGSIVTDTITYTRTNITNTYWSIEVAKDTDDDGVADDTQTIEWYLNKPSS
ncbi:MAG: hypothetical protein JXQ76_09830 [Campylobacterales bacterium]|nr:hypothetical protein [Campylobacterales bacterium]